MLAAVSVVILRVAIAALFFATVACNGQPIATVVDLAASCPNDLPAACPSPAPSFAAGISAIVAGRCATCHTPGGVAGTILLTNYADVYRRRVSVLTEVYSCYMPPQEEIVLPESERRDLLGWLVCGAPNN